MLTKPANDNVAISGVAHVAGGRSGRGRGDMEGGSQRWPSFCRLSFWPLDRKDWPPPEPNHCHVACHHPLKSELF